MKRTLLLFIAGVGMMTANAQCPPTISCPSNITVGTDPNLCGAVINYTTPVGLDTCVMGADSLMYSGSIVNWIIPAGVTSLTIEARGAEGGTGSSSTTTGGLGAIMIGDFAVTPGDTLQVLVGQHPSATSPTNGGGGGTFVVDMANNPLIVAGGGGGSSNSLDSPNKHGNTTTTGGQGTGGGGTGGINGNGGNIGASFASGAGGGFLTDGQDGWTANTGGHAFLNGGAGGTGGAVGGFGGGGTGSGYVVGAGGGGYSGGGGGSNSAGAGVGGGGGSFNAGTNQNNTGGVNNGHGFVKFTWGGAGQPTTQTAGLPSGSMFPVGTTTNTFVTTNSAGTDSCSFTVTVIDSGQVTVLGALSQDTICTSAGTLTLPAGTPAGGTYSGTGVTGNSFDPAAAQLGNHWIYYTDTVGCQNTDSAMITVVWCTGIEEGPLSDIVRILPNPSEGLFQLSIPQGEYFESLELFDVSGRKVWIANDPRSTTQVDLRGSANGLYMLHVGMKGQRQTFRLLKK